MCQPECQCGPADARSGFKFQLLAFTGRLKPLRSLMSARPSSLTDMMASVIASLLLLLLRATTGTSSPLVDVFVAGDDEAKTGIKQFRIPSLVRTGKGTLLAFAEGRTDPATDCGYKWIVVRRSADEGATWSSSVDVAGREWTGWASGNAQAVYHPQSGKVVITFGSKDLSFRGSCEPGTAVFAVDDGGSDGLRWGPPRNISGMLGEYGRIVPGPSDSTVLSKAPYVGRIVATGVTGAYANVISYFSDDGGISWETGTTPLSGGDESAPVELPDGRVYVTLRNADQNKTCDCQGYAISYDGGQTFGSFQYDPTLISPVCESSVAVLGDSRLYFANPASTTSRSDITVRATQPGAADVTDWVWKLLIAPGLTWGGYTSLASGGNGFGALLLERNNSDVDVISFARFALATPAPPPPPPVVIPALNGSWVGRHLEHADGSVSFDVPGVTVSFFVRNATTLTAIFTGACGGETTRLESGVDGDPLDTHSRGAFFVLAASPSSPFRILLADGLDPAVSHVLTIRVAVEARWASCSANSTITLEGIETDGVQGESSPPLSRRLEFVGDSITAAFGTAPPCTSPNSKTEDASRGAAFAVCANLSAECSLVAVSGDTAIVPTGGAPSAKPPIPLIYNRSLTYWADAESAWVFSSHSPPSAVIVNLGTNDVADSNFNASFRFALADFLTALSSSSGFYAGLAIPTALAFCGPMTDAYCVAMSDAVDAARARGADARFLGFVNATLDGCDGHPGAIGQREMGAALVPLIKAQLGW